jgi:catechol 2,3-dioxygenase-like lactoylglutathione lyase family enzyme
MNWTLEVVQVPVSDVDRAKAFYAERLGFTLDFDTSPGGGVRFAQLTPPGSGCSIIVGKGMTDMAPGSLQGLQLVVSDVRAARAQLVERGVDVSEVRVAGEAGFRPAQADDDLHNVGFVFFDDPDGNGWSVQQISTRS